MFGSMSRMLAAACCLALLAACSPTFDWRPVAFGHQGAAGVLPDTPQAQTRPVSFEGQTLELTMHSARAGGVLFALGSAELPPGWEASQSQWRGSKVTSRAVTPRRGRPRPAL